MEVQGSRRGRRDVSPDRARVCMQVQPKMKMFRKVQVVYYLCRNGQLEHPHFMEVAHLAGQQLRLKDVTDRLSVLRGRGMHSLFSWSCKRSYKNGYVWKDLAENDVIYPAEGSEYVLKGSELIQGCAERFQQLHVSTRHPSTEPMYHSKRIQLPATLRREIEQEEDEEINPREDERFVTSIHRRHRRSDGGVSTDIVIEEDDAHTRKAHHPTELTLDDSGSPPSSSSTPSDKAQAQAQPVRVSGGSQRFDEPAPEPAAARGSVLLNLFACGTGSARRNPSPSQGPVVAVAAMASQGAAVGGGSRRRSGGSLLQQGVLRRAARAVEEEISCMSENPRFGSQAEEKEYFSGSIVESVCEDRVQPGLKKSASYNEERSKTCGLASSDVEDDLKNLENACSSLKGKCIPRKRHLKHQTNK